MPKKSCRNLFLNNKGKEEKSEKIVGEIITIRERTNLRSSKPPGRGLRNQQTPPKNRRT